MKENARSFLAVLVAVASVTASACEGGSGADDDDGLSGGQAGGGEAGGGQTGGTGGDGGGMTYGLNTRPPNKSCLAPVSVDQAPKKLSETGCFKPGDLKVAAEGLIPYGVNTALWSDNAKKQRWMALPDGKTIGVDDKTGDFDFPAGTVLLKYFELDGIALETRFLSRLSSGDWALYTYVFDMDGKEANLLGDENAYRFFPQGDDFFEWVFPSRKNCFGCHTASAKVSLGPELAQFDGLYKYPNGQEANQVKTLKHIGVLASDVTAAPGNRALVSVTDANAALELKARSYLHANCSHCHQGNEVKETTLDLRIDVPLAKMNVCDINPSKNGYGIDNVKILAPGEPGRSMIAFRMNSTVQNVRMPAYGTKLVDQDAVAAVNAWISSLKNCD